MRVLDNLHTGHRGNLAALDVEFVHSSILDRMILSRCGKRSGYPRLHYVTTSEPDSLFEPDLSSSV